MINSFWRFLSIVVLNILVFSPVYAEDSESQQSSALMPGAEEMSQEEIDRHIGRMGEVEEIPEGFEFSEAETKLWLSDHLGNIKQPSRLYYEFVKTGSFEDGFTDSVYLDIIRLNEDGTKNVVLDFFSGERKQPIHPDNVTNIQGNPVLGIYMQGDVYEMNRLTEGSWRHFMKMIKIALRDATVEPVRFTFNGKEYEGDKILINPYEKDPHRPDFIRFADKTYEFILSDEIPGTLYQIRTVIRDNRTDKTDDTALIEESITLVEYSQS